MSKFLKCPECRQGLNNLPKRGLDLLDCRHSYRCPRCKIVLRLDYNERIVDGDEMLTYYLRVPDASERAKPLR